MNLGVISSPAGGAIHVQSREARVQEPSLIGAILTATAATLVRTWDGVGEAWFVALAVGGGGICQWLHHLCSSQPRVGIVHADPTLCESFFDDDLKMGTSRSCAPLPQAALTPRSGGKGQPCGTDGNWRCQPHVDTKFEACVAVGLVGPVDPCAVAACSAKRRPSVIKKIKLTEPIESSSKTLADGTAERERERD